MTQDQKLEAAMQALLDAQKKEQSTSTPPPAKPTTPPPAKPTTPPPAKPTTPPPATSAGTSQPAPTRPINAEELAPPEVKYDTRRSKGAAIALGIFLGWIGVHDFYLKRYVWGAIKVVLCMAGGAAFSAIWSIVDVIRIARGSIDKDAKGEYLK